MKARVRWLEPMGFVGETGSGHSIVMDGSPEFGGGIWVPDQWKCYYWEWVDAPALMSC